MMFLNGAQSQNVATKTCMFSNQNSEIESEDSGFATWNFPASRF